MADHEAAGRARQGDGQNLIDPLVPARTDIDKVTFEERFEASAIETGRVLFAQACAFVKGAVRIADLPQSVTPEVAFAGRSNVGKSSLMNALTGRKNLARTSNAPGRTREINFFDLGGRLMLVDLPGYGFARAPKARVETWTRLAGAYLRGRPNLKRVMVLIDARHGLKATDRETMKALDEAAVTYQIVLTKIDKLSPAAITAVRRATGAEAARHPAAYPAIAATSARVGHGIAELRATIAALAGP